MATNGKKIKRKYHTLHVCGSGVDKFFKQIGLDYEYKNQSYYGINTKANTNKEGKPVCLFLKPFFQKYKLPYRLFNIPKQSYIEGKTWATNKTINAIISKLKDLKSGVLLEQYTKLKKSKWTEKTLSTINSVETQDIENLICSLEKIKNNDLQYEKVKSVNYIDYNGYVYDLSVNGTHNYIANNLICHNTVQLISAAALRMQNKNQPTLIITLKATQAQWVNEIINVMGDAEKDNITTNPLTPRKWTVVYYDNFSSGKKVDDYVAALSRANFGIVIFDELHKVKHSTSKRSQNVAKVVENIPTRWGASATVSANKPMDVRNQLVMTGHHLGKVSEGKFKKDFAGYKPTGYRGAYEQDDSDDEQIKSAERLNRWLNLSGVYVRRAKKDVREMPNITVGDKTTPIDQGRFQQHYATKVASYKDPSLPISKLIAARETVAHLKTDQTTSKVLGIVSSNLDKSPAASKVVVFTNFVEAGKQLVDKIGQGLRQINPSFYALTYLAETKKAERAGVKQRFTNDPNAKVLIMSMRMGGTGIDFPNASQNMVINDFDWTPEAAEQSEGRIYRINTEHPVNIEYMVGEGIDKKLFQLVQKKRKLAGIIQAYRKEYHENEHDAETLEKLVMAQKQMRAIDREMVDIVNDELPGAGNALGESFRDYIDNLEELRELWLYGVSL
jgi:superfamily II DNA or RNA helicase